MTAVAESGAPVATALPECPYLGLDPFTDVAREYFFGREEETMTIAANLLTAPVTVLYGASGVGKSSLLMAGVAPFVRSQKNTTVVLFRSWQQPDLIGALNRAVADAVRQKTDDPVDESQGFDVCVASAVAKTKGAISIIFDQFEEFLEHHAMKTDAGAVFDRQFARLANRNDAPVNFLLAIREDCAAKLDRFQRHIPHLMSNLIRLEHLNLEGARCAIIKPLERYNEALLQRDPHAGLYGIEGNLVEKVLMEVRSGPASESRIETPFLQMILEAMWNEEQDQNSRTLRVETLYKLGGADLIVHNYVENVVLKLSPQLQEVCARMFDHLVTPSGTKIVHSAADLEDMVGDDCRSGVPEVLKALADDSRILRQVEAPTDKPRYEIFHDVLSKPLVKWRAGYQSVKHERYRARTARRRMTAFLIVASIVTFAALWNAVESRNRQTNRKKAKALVAEAKAGVKNGQPAAAAAAVKKARPVYTDLGDPTGESVFEEISSSLVEAARSHREKPDAYYDAAISITSDPRRKARTLLLLARVRVDRGDLPAARESLEEAARELAAINALRLQLQLGELWLLAGRADRARPVLEAVVKKSGEDGATAADAYLLLGVIHEGKDALRSLAEAAKFYQKDRPQEYARTLMTMAAVHAKMGHDADATAASTQAVEALRRAVKHGVFATPLP
jgi:tetratricopeptide (TPR) repeat protein